MTAEEGCDGPPSTDGGPRVGAVLLAAGQNRRFEGGNKLLAPIDETPVVEHAAETLLAADAEEVVVVVGHEAAAVRDALGGRTVSFRTNPDHADGQSSSVRTGVEAARDQGWDGAVFALGDMPFVDAASVDALVEQYATGTESIVAAAYDGGRGNPVLFDARHYERLANLTGDSGGRNLLQQRDDVALVETDDPGVTLDIDAREDLSEAANAR